MISCRISVFWSAREDIALAKFFDANSSPYLLVSTRQTQEETTLTASSDNDMLVGGWLRIRINRAYSLVRTK